MYPRPGAETFFPSHESTVHITSFVFVRGTETKIIFVFIDMIDEMIDKEVQRTIFFTCRGCGEILCMYSFRGFVDHGASLELLTVDLVQFDVRRKTTHQQLHLGCCMNRLCSKPIQQVRFQYVVPVFRWVCCNFYFPTVALRSFHRPFSIGSVWQRLLAADHK